MNKSLKNIVWGGDSALICLSGGALLIMASDRLAHALVLTGALLWVYLLSAFTIHVSARILPRQGRTVLLAFLTSFFAALFLLVVWILSPLCALETFFIIVLVPMFCMVSGIFKKPASSLKETLRASFFEAVILGMLVVIFSLIREPIGYLSLSLPGGALGIILLFSFAADTAESFFPVRLIAGSGGALLLLGYLSQMYRYFRSKNTRQEDNDER